MDPGEFSGAKYADNASAEMRRAAEADGLEFASDGTTGLPPARAGYYLVALIAANADRYSYHWLRREVDGRWTHKPGKESVRETDADAGQVNDANPPHTANFNFRRFFETHRLGAQLLPAAEAAGMAINYDRFVGYFYCPDGGLQLRTRRGRGSGGRGGCTVQ